jgi:1,4-dihydroxy-2-naphthoate octaprenyltransferase
MIITVVLLYIHTVMDYEFDLNEGHNTIANRFDSQLDSLIVLKILLISAYLSVVFLCIPDIVDWQVFLTFITIPLAIDLYKSLFMFSENPEAVPERKWYHFPMENWNKLEKQNEISFMMRMYQSRNLMIYFSLFMTLGIIFSLLI